LKKKEIILLASTFILTSVVLYFFVFIYIFYVKGLQDIEIIKNKNEIEFIERYAKKLHHVRHYNNKYYKHNKVNELLFTEVQKHGSKKKFLFMGDSWFEQLIFYKNSSEEINTYFNKKKIDYINAAISSYSPTLITLQYKILKNDFKLNPNYVVVYIDQTDFGDEVCRYKKNRYFNKKTGKLEGVKDIYFLPRTSAFYNIANSSSHYLIKDFKMFNFFINERFRLIKNKTSRILNKDLNIYGCHISKILNNLINPSNEEILYFQDTIDLMLDTLVEDANIKKILVVTFPHRNNLKEIKNFNITRNRNNKETLKLDIFKKNKNSKNLVIKDFKINVADFVNSYIQKNNDKKILHLDFTKNFNLGEVDITDKSYKAGDPASHLDTKDHLNTFTKSIIVEIDNILKLHE